MRVGTRVWLRPQAGGERRAIMILGPYEGDPENGIVSHGSEAAQALLEKAVGDAVSFDGAAWTVDRDRAGRLIASHGAPRADATVVEIM